MKRPNFAATVIALSLIVTPAVFAQVTETPTDKSNTSATEPSEATKTPTPAASVSEKSLAAKSEKTKASPVAKATPAATAAQRSVARGNVESQLKEIEDTYERAVQSHNLAAIEPFVADDCVVTNFKGRVMDRRAWLSEFKKDTDTYTNAKNMKMTVHMAAANVAIVTGRSREIGQDKAGKAFDRTFLWTDTFVDRNGKWMVVGSHSSLVASK